MTQAFLGLNHCSKQHFSASYDLHIIFSIQLCITWQNTMYSIYKLMVSIMNYSTQKDLEPRKKNCLQRRYCICFA